MKRVEDWKDVGRGAQGSRSNMSPPWPPWMMRGGGLERWSLGKEGETGRVQGSGSRWTAGYAGEGRAKAGGMMKWAGDRR